MGPVATSDAVAAAARLRSQLLAGPAATSPEQVVERLLAVQGQDPRGFRLSVRSRSRGTTASDVDTALTSTRSLVVTWVNRGTLHLVRADDYWWLHPLTTPQLVTGNQRRLRQEGVSAPAAARGVDIITEAVDEGPHTRRQLRTRLDAAQVPTAGQALVHILMAASLAGHVVRGPMVGKEQAYVAVREWLGPAPARLDRDEALATLARRYLAGHGPASPADLVKWAGVTLRDARTGFDAIAASIEQVTGGLFAMADDAPSMRAGRRPPPRLLGPFDPLLHGWASRESVVGTHASVVTSNGLFRPAALVNGRVVATWSLPGGTVTIQPLEPIPAAAMKALVEDATDVLRFLGLPPRPAVVLA